MSKKRVRALTAKGLGVKEGQRIWNRYALRNAMTKEVVYVYGNDEGLAMGTANAHFGGEATVVLEHAGYVEWKIIGKGTSQERAVQHTVFLAGHDASLPVDNVDAIRLKKG